MRGLEEIEQSLLGGKEVETGLTGYNKAEQPEVLAGATGVKAGRLVGFRSSRFQIWSYSKEHKAKVFQGYSMEIVGWGSVLGEKRVREESPYGTVGFQGGHGGGPTCHC